MAEEIKQRTMNTRISHKHDTPANWAKAKATDSSPGFIPCAGEIIIYDEEDLDSSVAPRVKNFKIGDGVTNVNNLHFLIDPIIKPSSISNVISAQMDGFTLFDGARLKVDLMSLGVTSTASVYISILSLGTTRFNVLNASSLQVKLSSISYSIFTLEFIASENAFKIVEQKCMTNILPGSVYATNNGFLSSTASNANNGNAGFVYLHNGVTSVLACMLGKNGISVSYSPTGNVFYFSGSTFGASGTTAKMGMVPAPPTTAGTSLYLREDGTWASPSTSTLGALSVGSASKPVYFSNGTPVEANRIPTIRIGNDMPSHNVGEDGDMFIVTSANRLPRIYSGTTEPDYSIGVNGDIYIQYN